MASPQYGVPVILHYGNADSGTQGAPPAIEHRIYAGIQSPFGGHLAAPNLTGRAPRMPLIERITPRNVNAQKLLETRRAQMRVMIMHRRRQAVDVVRGYTRSIRARRPQHFTGGIDVPLVGVNPNP